MRSSAYPRVAMTLTRTVARSDHRSGECGIRARAAHGAVTAGFTDRRGASALSAALPAQELARVTEHVLRTLDRRVLSYRERTGQIRHEPGTRTDHQHRHRHPHSGAVQSTGVHAQPRRELCANRDPRAVLADPPVRQRQSADARDGAISRHLREAPGRQPGSPARRRATCASSCARSST